MVLGLPPDWYKSRSYRSRAVREPRAVLAEFGTALADTSRCASTIRPPTCAISSSPSGPKGTDGWSEERLAALVTRDSMIGVCRANEPG